MGRNKTSDIEKRIKGTDQPVRMSGDSQLHESVSKLPPAPQWLSTPARKMYKTLGASMVTAGILSELNLITFAMLCSEVGKYIELTTDVKKEGYTYTWTDTVKNRKIITSNPKVKLASDALKNAKVIASEFGMTPASLARIASMINNKPEQDDFEKFLNA